MNMPLGCGRLIQYRYNDDASQPTMCLHGFEGIFRIYVWFTFTYLLNIILGPPVKFCFILKNRSAFLLSINAKCVLLVFSAL